MKDPYSRCGDYCVAILSLLDDACGREHDDCPETDDAGEPVA